jgi:hypothetical protein
MPIKNLSDIRRLPRLGSIHLGIKKVASSGKEYPAEVDFFVCPPAVQAVFGEKPTELRIMFPVDNDAVFFQQWNKCYTTNLLQCKGDGEKAFTWDAENGGMKEIPCPCEKLGKECKPIGVLQFLLPDVPGAGVWQITTSSKTSIVDVNSSIAFVRSICGRIHMIPLILKREKREMQRIEDGKPKKSTHYTLKIDVDEKVTLRQLQQSAQISPETVLLPPADESKDELYYPENGFKPEEEAVVVPESVEAPEDDKKALEVLLAELKESGYLLGKKQTAFVDDLKTRDDYKKAVAFFKEKKAALAELPF